MVGIADDDMVEDFDFKKLAGSDEIAGNFDVRFRWSGIGEGDDIGEPLMIAFVLMVGQIFLERVAQGTFAKENQLIETLILGGTDPAFREGVEVW